MPPDERTSAICRCIWRFAGARSSRGVYKAERQLAAELGGTPIDVATAAAARRVGELIRDAAANAACAVSAR